MNWLEWMIILVVIVGIPLWIILACVVGTLIPAFGIFALIGMVTYMVLLFALIVMVAND